MDPRMRRLQEEPVGKLLWHFSLPAIAGMMVGSLYTVIDRAFLGNVVGPDALAGLSVCMPITFVMLAFGMLIGVGTGALVSIRLGQQKHAEAEVILGNATTLTLVVAVVIGGGFLLVLTPLLTLFGASPVTLPYAKQFLQIILLGSFFQYASFGLNAIIRAEGNPRLAMLTMFINASINIILDVVFVLWLDFGVPGAAVATVIAQAVSAIWTLGHFRSRRSVLRLHLKNLVPHWQIIRPALAIGLSPFVMHLGASVISLLANRGLSHYGGDVAVGAYGIISALSMLILMPVFGLNQGAQPIVGYNFGAANIARVKHTLKLSVLAATGVVLIGFVLVEAFPTALVHAFAKDPLLIQVGARGLRICLVMLPIVGFQVVSANFFQAVGKARTALVLSLLRQVIVLIPLLILLPHVMGLDGVWAAGPIADGVASLLTGFALLRELRHLDALPGPAAPNLTNVTAAVGAE